METNTFGPMLMAKHFSPLLKKGQGHFGKTADEPKKQHGGVLVNMSAKVGSIGDNGKFFTLLMRYKVANNMVGCW